MPPVSSRNPRAGGAIIAIAVMAGAAIGGVLHQPSIGILAGIGIGILTAVAIWLIDRRRTG